MSGPLVLAEPHVLHRAIGRHVHGINVFHGIDDDIEEYETVVIEEDEDDGHGVDPTDILETARKGRGFRGKRGSKK